VVKYVPSENNLLRLSEGDFGFREIKYSHFLCFSIQSRTNKLVYSQTCKYTPEQQKLYELIKSLNEEGLSYRRITKYLNERGIPTHTGKKWGVTGNTVYSVLKKYRERIKRLELLKREYEPVWGKMEVRWEKVV